MRDAPHPVHVGSFLIGGNRIEAPPPTEAGGPVATRVLKRVTDWLKTEGLNRRRVISQPTLTQLMAACQDYRQQKKTASDSVPIGRIRSPYYSGYVYDAVLLERDGSIMGNGSVYVVDLELPKEPSGSKEFGSRTLPIISGSHSSPERGQWQEWTVWLENGQGLLEIRGEGQTADGNNTILAGSGMHQLSEHFGRQLRDVVNAYLPEADLDFIAATETERYRGVFD